MNFAAVKSFFKPLTRAQLEELARQHGGSRGEQAVSLEDVGLDRVAHCREALKSSGTPDARQVVPLKGLGDRP